MTLVGRGDEHKRGTMEPESDSDGVEVTAETAAPSPAAAAAAPAAAAPRNAFTLLGKRPAPPSAEEAAEAKAAAERARALARWDSFKYKPYLDTSDSACTRYVADGTVVCTWCPASSSSSAGGASVLVRDSTGNLTKHEITKDHQRFATAHNTAATARLGAANVVDFQEASLTSAEKALHGAKVLELRALTHALAVSYNIAPNNMSNIIGPSSSLASAVEDLNKHHVAGLGSRSCVDRDLNVAYDVLVAQLREKLKGVQGTIITDAGTLMDSKGIAVLFMSSAIGTPILLDVCFPEALDDDARVVVYDVEKCACDVRAVLELLGIDLETQVRFVAGAAVLDCTRAYIPIL